MEQTSNTVKNRILWLDLLRIAAAFAVVLTHVTRSSLRSAAFSNPRIWLQMVSFNSAVRWQNPVFFMISGALLLGREPNIPKLYKKNLLRFVIAFFVWSTVYAILQFDPQQGAIKLIRNIIDGPSIFWFIPTLAGLYMLTPLFRQLVKNERYMKYYLVISFIFAFVLKQAASIAGLFSEGLESMLLEPRSRLGLSVGNSSFYFVFGYYLANVKLSKKQSTAAAVLGLIGFISTAAGTVILSRIMGYSVELLFNLATVNALLESMLVFLAFRKLFENHTFGERAQRVITSVSKWTFGTYLIHFAIILILQQYGIHALRFTPLISVPILSVSIFAVSLLISALLNQIPIFNKYAI